MIRIHWTIWTKSSTEYDTPKSRSSCVITSRPLTGSEFLRISEQIKLGRDDPTNHDFPDES